MNNNNNYYYYYYYYYYNLFPEDRIRLISADAERVSLQLEVDRGVVVSYVRHVLNAVDPLRHDVGVFHGNQRHLHAGHVAHISRPHACPEKYTTPPSQLHHGKLQCPSHGVQC